jgi:hypothetical protein
MTRTTLRHADRPSPNGHREHAPVAAPSVVSISGPTHRKPSWVLLGALLVGVAAVLGAWVFSVTSQQMSVVVAGRNIEPGEVISAADLTVVEMGKSGGLRAIMSNQQDLVIGRSARGPIPAGTVLNTDLFAEVGQVIPPGMVVVGASLDPGAAPVAGLRSGDRVEVLGVESATGAPTQESSTPSAATLASGTVWSVERPSASSPSAKLWVAVVVPAEAQGAVAQAAADGLLWLSLVGAGE